MKIGHINVHLVHGLLEPLVCSLGLEWKHQLICHNLTQKIEIKNDPTLFAVFKLGFQDVGVDFT